MLAIVSAICLVCAANTWVVARHAHIDSATMAAVLGAAAIMTIAGVGSCALLVRIVAAWGVNGLLKSCVMKRKQVRIVSTDIVTTQLITDL